MGKYFLIPFLLISSVISSCSKDLPPFKIHFVEREKEVLFYGSAHSNNISNPMFADIEGTFNHFRPEVVLIEGGYANRLFNTKEQAAVNGEMAFVNFLASTASTPTFDIEPNSAYVDSILLSHFSSNLIFTMYILRQTYQYQAQSKQNDIDFVGEIMNYANIITDNGRFEFESPLRFENIYKIVEEESGIVITWDNWSDKTLEVRRYLYNRARIRNPVQSVHHTVVEIRDEYAISLIVNKVEENDRVFVIMGNQHLLNQQKRLREELKNRFSK